MYTDELSVESNLIKTDKPTNYTYMVFLDKRRKIETGTLQITHHVGIAQWARKFKKVQAKKPREIK